MIKTMINAWKVPDIRKKLLFTAFIILSLIHISEPTRH